MLRHGSATGEFDTAQVCMLKWQIVRGCSVRGLRFANEAAAVDRLIRGVLCNVDLASYGYDGLFLAWGIFFTLEVYLYFANG